MSVRTITVKEIISRVRQVFPDAPEKYIMSLINDALVELGMYNSKVSTAKLSTTANQMYYSLKDAAEDSSNNILEPCFNPISECGDLHDRVPKCLP